MINDPPDDGEFVDIILPRMLNTRAYKHFKAPSGWMKRRLGLCIVRFWPGPDALDMSSQQWEEIECKLLLVIE